jgi:hypothetical protein
LRRPPPNVRHREGADNAPSRAALRNQAPASDDMTADAGGAAGTPTPAARASHGVDFLRRPGLPVLLIDPSAHSI